MPSAEHEQIVAMMSEGLGLERLSVVEQRAFMEASASMFPPEPDVSSDEIDVNGIPADWITVGNAHPIVLYLHGGGYVAGSRNTHRDMAGRIARAADARVLLPEYRLAPEHPFPAAVEDASMCWRWLVSEGYAPELMAIAGDSAGGGLALATLLSLKSCGDALPACGVALSPWTDLERTGPTVKPGTVDDPLLTPEGLRLSSRQYAANDLSHPLVSPINGKLEGLPPLLLQVGTRELLLSDSTRFAERAKAAGVDVTIEIEEGLIHVWQMFPGIPESKQAMARIGKYIQHHC